MERYSIVIPFYDEFHDLAYGDMVSQMILDRLEKGDATVDEFVRELGVEDIEVHLEWGVLGDIGNRGWFVRMGGV